jgi:Tetratricopeptide repeat
MGRDPGIEPARLIRWMRQALTSEKNPWFLNTLGIALYRAGRDFEAIQALEESMALGWGDDGKGDGKAANQMVLAMIHWRRGDHSKAGGLLKEATKRLVALSNSATDGVAPVLPTDWLPLQVLRREAEAVILYDPIFPVDPYAH